MGRLDGSTDGFGDQQFQQTVQSDLDMLVLETMHANTRRQGRSAESRGSATAGWRNRGIFFWVILTIMVYWFILRPLGL